MKQSNNIPSSAALTIREHEICGKGASFNPLSKIVITEHGKDAKRQTASPNIVKQFVDAVIQRF